MHCTAIIDDNVIKRYKKTSQITKTRINYCYVNCIFIFIFIYFAIAFEYKTRHINPIAISMIRKYLWFACEMMTRDFNKRWDTHRDNEQIFVMNDSYALHDIFIMKIHKSNANCLVSYPMIGCFFAKLIYRLRLS